MSFRIRKKEEALKEISNLVEVFENNLRSYKSNSYDEANTRADFIDKFFEALNWDVRNDNNKAERFRNVIREDKVEIQGSLKAPDYSFSIGGQKLFFVEAKKPSVDIEKDIDPAYQLRRYAYTAKLPISILTDFEELAIYDTRVKPKKNDKASTSRIEFIKYTDYVKKFDFIWETFEFNAVEQGKLDKYVGSDKKKGTATIDKDLLNTIENWRVNLASNIALRNIKLSLEDLNFAVQKIVDRIIFLRIVEEKGIEQAEHLLYISNTKKGVYKELVKYFDSANERYNAGLFQKYNWLNNIEVDDNILIEIIKSLYFPECPYAWDVLPIEILGNIYEKFLGSEITFKNVRDGKHTAKVEEKPEVRKAGGVYYTPQYIVDYIVNETLGKKLEKSNAKDASKITICDPACGSGSFLVGAYKYLLNWYLEKYTSTSSITKESLAKDENGYARIENIGDNKNKKYKLTIEEKKRILKDHIYGVDIDFKATEVAKLSLFLVLLDGEGKKSGWGEQSINQVLDYKLLPNMSNNIKCGNSLVATDFYTSSLTNIADKELQVKINAFDWEKEFDAIFKNGGFDIVIGNPPYFNVQTLGANSSEIKYIQNKYNDIWQDKSDILFYFINKAMEISKDKIGYIISNAFLFSDKASKLRNKLLRDERLHKVINFGDIKIFDAGISTCIIIFQKNEKNKKKNIIQAMFLKQKKLDTKEIINYINDEKNLFNVNFEENKVFALTDEKESNVNEKIDKNAKKLSDILFVGKGMETAANEVFCFDALPKFIPKKYLKRRMSGESIKRYYKRPDENYMLYFEFENDFEKLPSSIKQHLLNNKKVLLERATVKNEGRAWWRYSRPMHKEMYDKCKIWCSYRAKDNEFVLDETNDFIGLSNTTVIFDTNTEYNIKYILAIINSKLINYRYKSIAKMTGNGVYEYVPNAVGRIPIIYANKETQKQFVILVDKMIQAMKNIYNATSDKEKKNAQDIVDALDREINAKVYELYGLTKEEIEEVEKQSI